MPLSQLDSFCMKSKTTHQRLSDEEFDRVAEFLARLGPPVLTLEALDGYFAALICGPDMVLPEEYLPVILSNDRSSWNTTCAENVAQLLLRHWNTMSSDLRRTLQSPLHYLPMLLGSRESGAQGNEWARGFMLGISLGSPAWRELIERDDFGGPLLPFILFAHERDPDPALELDIIPPDQREHLLRQMVVNVATIYRYFEPQRLSQARRCDPAGDAFGQSDDRDEGRRRGDQSLFHATMDRGTKHMH
jgi:uncharacterized protein